MAIFIIKVLITGIDSIGRYKKWGFNILYFNGLITQNKNQLKN